MFGRFRKTNDPARETDGGAVAVDDPATSVATPAADPAVRERRLAELQATQAGDPDTRGLDRERAVTTGRTADERARLEPIARRDRSRGRERSLRAHRARTGGRARAGRRARSRRRAADDPGRRRRGHRGGHARPPARPLRRHPLGQRLLRPAERHRPGRDPAGHRRCSRRGLRPVGDQRRPHGHRRHHRTRRRHPAAGHPRALLVLRRLRRRAHGALRRRCARASACGCGRW